jgi:hypothetical protein
MKFNDALKTIKDTNDRQAKALLKIQTAAQMALEGDAANAAMLGRMLQKIHDEATAALQEPGEGQS